MNRRNMSKIFNKNSLKKINKDKLIILDHNRVGIAIISINCLISTKQDRKLRCKLIKELPFKWVQWFKKSLSKY